MNGCRGICVIPAWGPKLDSSPCYFVVQCYSPPILCLGPLQLSFVFIHPSIYLFLQPLLPIQADICTQAIYFPCFFLVLGTALLNLLNVKLINVADAVIRFGLRTSRCGGLVPKLCCNTSMVTLLL
jgi:hypothetical protein